MPLVILLLVGLGESAPLGVGDDVLSPEGAPPNNPTFRRFCAEAVVGGVDGCALKAESSLLDLESQRSQRSLCSLAAPSLHAHACFLLPSLPSLRALVLT